VHPLDEILPRFDVRELHERVVDLPTTVAVRAILSAPAAPGPFARALLALRGVGKRDGDVEELLRGIGCEPVVSGEDVAVFRRDGRVTIVVAFWAEPRADGRTVLRAETRVRARDDAARRRFRVYWLVVRPFSGLIRRAWLSAAVR
jgi:hypothetical protein